MTDPIIIKLTESRERELRRIAASIQDSGIYPEVLELISAGENYNEECGMSWPRLALLPDGTREVLTEDLHFMWNGIFYVVPRGFVTDWASVPRLFRRVINQRGAYSAAALCHDWLYFSGSTTKLQADTALFDLAKVLGANAFDQRALYWGVRVGGFMAWNHYRKLEKARSATAPAGPGLFG